MTELVYRVADALRQLELLNETKAQQKFEKSVSGGKDGSGVPTVDTAFDHFHDRLERWCRDAEKRVREQRKGQADEKGRLPALKGESKAYWLLESYQGVEYREAARELGLEPKTVVAIRIKGSALHPPQTGEYGRPRQRAPRAA